MLKGRNAKAKANLSAGIKELINIAYGRNHVRNNKKKHLHDAKYGWFRYESRFAIPVFDDNDEIEKYNVYDVALIVRHSEDGKLYLYDVLNIRKETSTLFHV